MSPLLIIMTIAQTIILGVIEGVTEFLPVSSTGHMVLIGKLMGVVDSDFLKSFEIIIQSGAILAVVVLYWKKLFSGVDGWKKVLTAFLPTAIIGFLLYKLLKQYLLSNAVMVLWSLFLGGVLLIVFEMWYAKRKSVPDKVNELSYKQSFLTGLAQSLAIIPGVSRSGATIVAGLLMGINRQTIVEFSFLLAIPTMAAATGYDLLKSAHTFSFSQFHLLALGFMVSFMVAILAVKWFIGYIKNHSFIWFGVYRIVIATVFYLLLFQFKI
jgi:undecaprenyl-diphosphatase